MLLKDGRSISRNIVLLNTNIHDKINLIMFSLVYLLLTHYSVTFSGKIKGREEKRLTNWTFA